MTEQKHTPTSLTAEQKLQALAYRFYQGGQWEPKAGDYYTTSRADLELYQVVDVRDGKVFTRYLVGSHVISEWDASEFLADHTFGRRRVFVPQWILAPAPLAPLQRPVEVDATVINGSPIAKFVASYQFDASDEGFVHTPTFHEQTMIEDAICSFISDGELLRAALSQQVQS